MKPLLEMHGIDKSFPGVRALSQVNLDLDSGQVLALLGENGAGKSTLVKILSGATRPDGGEIRIQGKAVRFNGPADAMAAGIGMIYQEFNLISELTVCENLFLGRERRWGWVQRSQERSRALELFATLGGGIRLDARCGDLSIGQQQIVEIAKALSQQARLIVMDEPSATLMPEEVKRLMDVVRNLRARPMGVIYISHRLDEVFEIADRVMVLRDGKNVGDGPIGDWDRRRVIKAMVGREIDLESPRRSHNVGAPRLEVSGLSGARQVRDVSFHINQGEVLGLTGLVGAGRTSLARLLFGAERRRAGVVSLDGRRLNLRNPRDAIAAGICLLTEDRKRQGLVLQASVRENFALPNLAQFSRCGFVRNKLQRSALARFVDRLAIRIANQEQPARELSGGNQQKVMLARWLQRDAQVVILDEPTRGVDVGAKCEIYQCIHELTQQGKSVLMISSELPEVLSMSDRILVMRQGSISGEINDVANATQQQIMRMAVEEIS